MFSRMKHNGHCGHGLALLLLLMLVGGCATTAKPQAPAAMLDAWELRGKLGLRATGQAANLSFQWSQRSEGVFRIRLLGPLGVSLGSVEGNTAWAVADFDGELIEGPGDSLLLPTLGFNVPLSSMYYWVRGLPDPSMPDVTSDSGFVQGRWTIDVTKGSEADDLPRKVNIQGNDLSVRLAAMRWR